MVQARKRAINMGATAGMTAVTIATGMSTAATGMAENIMETEATEAVTMATGAAKAMMAEEGKVEEGKVEAATTAVISHHRSGQVVR